MYWFYLNPIVDPHGPVSPKSDDPVWKLSSVSSPGLGAGSHNNFRSKDFYSETSSSSSPVDNSAVGSGKNLATTTANPRSKASKKFSTEESFFSYISPNVDERPPSGDSK